MWNIRSVCACALVCWWAVCWSAAQVAAQTIPSETKTQELQRQIEQLQKRLKSLEGGHADPAARSATLEKQKVTDLGSRRNTREPRMVVRIYDLNDLFAIAPSYEAQRSTELGGAAGPVFPHSNATQLGGGGMGGGGGFFSVRETLNFQLGTGSNGADAARTSLDTLIDVITSTISPEEWSEVGGSANIRKLGLSLVVSADASAHEQIELLLGQLRTRWKTLRTVSVQAWWLWMTDEQLAAVVPSTDQPSREGQPFGLVEPDAWRDYLAQLRAAENAVQPGYRSVVTCYNGQTVHTQSGGESLAVTELEPQVVALGEKEQVVGYSPQVQVPREGATLQVTPVATSAGKYAILDLHSRVSRLDRPKGKAQAAGANGKAAAGEVAAALDRPLLTTQRISTTLRVPVDQIMLAGGMSFESEPPPGAATLYLFVRVSVQELRDDTKEEPSATPVDEDTEGAHEHEAEAAEEE